jgi:transposase-like protein
MSAWRDVQERARQLEKQRRWWPVRVLGLDGAYVRGWGKPQQILVAVDMGTGQPVTVGYVDEKNLHAVKRFLKPLVQRLGVRVIVGDDLASFHIVANQLGLEQQICQFHLRRWVGRTLRDLKRTVPAEWVWVVEETQTLIKELPIQVDRRLMQLWRQIPKTRQGRNGGLNISPRSTGFLAGSFDRVLGSLPAL